MVFLLLLRKHALVNLKLARIGQEWLADILKNWSMLPLVELWFARLINL